MARCPGCGAESALEASPDGLCPKCLLRTGLDAPSPTPERIGKYKVLERIGEGGMGEVLLAEQTEPVRRKVAIKLIKWGMDTRQVVARFDSERRTLAVMDHPNIAAVHDAGATASGRPYFVMEYVPGLPITEFCDTRRLGIRERLDLFCQVCDGVQHAHQKGIIHRDVKATNVLVKMQDDKPVPKIIDFGVAKATEQRLTEESVFTEMGMLIGTPEYMSPEQAGMSDLDVDTRTDVYSLGVLLYDLLVGVLPFGSTELRRAGYDEIRRLIIEEQPGKPSTRIHALGDAATDVADRRHADPTSLARRLRGDLDWITMKTLEKDRRRRYDSPADLALDIRRHLDHQPVIARPPSVAYRASKFVRRHRVGVGALGTVVVLLSAFTVTTAVQSWRVSQEARRSERVAEFLAEMIRNVNPERMGKALRDDYRERVLAALVDRGGSGDETETEIARYESLTGDVNATDAALRLIDEEILARAADAMEEQFASDPLIEARLRHTLGKAYFNLGLYDRARTHHRRAMELRKSELGDDHPDTLDSMDYLARALHYLGERDAAERLFREALEGKRRVLGADHPDTLITVNNLGKLLQDQGKLEESEVFLRESLEGIRRALGADHPDTLRMMTTLGSVIEEQGGLEEAESYYREVLESARDVLGEENASTLAALNNLGGVLRAQGRFEEAEPYHREVLETRRRVLGNDHPDTLISINNLAMVLQGSGELAEAEVYAREALETSRRVLGDDHANTLIFVNNLGLILANQGKLEEAEPYFLEALEGNRRTLGNDHPTTLTAINNMGSLSQYLGKLDDAEAYLLEALEGTRRVLGNDHPDVARALNNLGKLARARGDLEEAESYLREAMDVANRALGKDHVHAMYTAESLAEVLEVRGKLEEAAELSLDLLERRRRVLGEDHSDTLLSLIAVARTAARRGKREEALEYLRRSADHPLAGGQEIDGSGFESLHGDPEYETLVARFHTQGGEE